MLAALISLKQAFMSKLLCGLYECHTLSGVSRVKTEPSPPRTFPPCSFGSSASEVAEMLVASLSVLIEIFWDICSADERSSGPGEASSAG